MKRSQLALAVAGLVASSVSYATVDYYGTTGSDATAYQKAPSLWAKELAGSQTSPLILRAQGSSTMSAGDKYITPLNIKVPVGFVVPLNQSYFIRIDLDNGARFNADPTCSAAAGSCNKSLGGKSSSFVTFELKATPAEIAPTTALEFQLPAGTGGTDGGIIVDDTSKNISFTYSLHTSKDSAETEIYSNRNKLLDTKGNYISFVQGVGAKFTAGTNLTSDVVADFLSFTSVDGVSGSQRGELGRFSYGPNTGESFTVGGTNPILVNDLATTAPAAGTSKPIDDTGMFGFIVSDTSTTVELSAANPSGFAFLQDATGTVASGTYSAATTKVFLLQTPSSNATAPHCVDKAGAAATINATKVTADAVTFTAGSSAATATKPGINTTYAVCIEANKAIPIAANEYSVKLVPGATATSKPSTLTDKLRAIVQNGTVLDTPFVTLFPGYISRVVFSNTGSNPVKYTATVVTDDGATATLGTAGSGSIPAGKLFEVNTSDLVTLSGKPRGAVRFTISGSNQVLGGVFQVVKISPTVGDVQNLPLIRRGGNADPVSK
jgi:hypothetical protein